ncbi:hypothetical protein C6P63_22520 [Burkholderia cenocepacia]|nr:hypothetical protein C6P63_22520 [Burkholderia cenocepacia]RQV08459.1 hypothetical protein DF042_02940 [Burkholderia cenocepacia]
MPEIARMAASFVACLARPNGVPHSWPCERFQAFACTFPMQAGPKFCPGCIAGVIPISAEIRFRTGICT